MNSSQCDSLLKSESGSRGTTHSCRRSKDTASGRDKESKESKASHLNDRKVRLGVKIKKVGSTSVE